MAPGPPPFKVPQRTTASLTFLALAAAATAASLSASDFVKKPAEPPLPGLERRATVLSFGLLSLVKRAEMKPADGGPDFSSQQMMMPWAALRAIAIASGPWTISALLFSSTPAAPYSRPYINVRHFSTCRASLPETTRLALNCALAASLAAIRPTSNAPGPMTSTPAPRDSAQAGEISNASKRRSIAGGARGLLSPASGRGKI
mmetsp:Transcript_5772/g.20575  ORF Transcript_5772/g.20575 Transcript_5772/m.20575 type:complete len:203 (+) Transcript_5772:415-1023(+)